VQVRAQERLLPPGHPDTQLVREVGERIVKALPHTGEDISGCWQHLARYKWEFVAVHSDKANAFVVPGGKVVVYTGARSSYGCHCGNGGMNV
jgi:predicted Zn-dependent protease